MGIGSADQLQPLPEKADRIVSQLLGINDGQQRSALKWFREFQHVYREWPDLKWNWLMKLLDCEEYQRISHYSHAKCVHPQDWNLVTYIDGESFENVIAEEVHYIDPDTQIGFLKDDDITRKVNEIKAQK